MDVSNAQATIYSRFLAVASAHLDEPCIRDEHRQLTYSEFLGLIGNLGSKLPFDSFVGVVMEHGIEQIATLFALLANGCSFVPAEPDFPPERIGYMLRDCDVKTLVTQTAIEPDVSVDSVVFIDADAKDFESPWLEDHATPDTIAYVLYTSGTTGAPKGVQVTNANVCAYARAFGAEFHPSGVDTMLQYSVCTFDIFIEEVFAALLNGAQLAIPTAYIRSDIERTVQFASDSGVTMISGFPYLFAEMNARRLIPPQLRLALSGGDVLHHGQVDWLVDQVELYNTYGPSETTVCATYFRCNDSKPMADGTYPIGKSIAGYEVQLLDEQGKKVGRGNPGEIVISGLGVSAGYRGAVSNGAFRLNESGEATYHSGDIAYENPDGDLVFLHRKDSQVMIEGRRVEPAEVENVLESAPGVKAAVVCAFKDSHNANYLCAYLVFHNPAAAASQLAAIQVHLRRFLPSYMMPEFYVSMASIPLTINGKPDTASLPQVLKG